MFVNNIAMLIESEGIIERVRYMMECMNSNATTFATEAHITPSVISHMLNGRNRPTIETLNNIIAAYPEWSYEWLLFGKGNPKVQGESPSADPLESNLFDTTVTTIGLPSSITHRPIGVQQVSHAVEVQNPLTEGEIVSLRQMLQQKKSEERGIREIRILYSDGSYEVFVAQDIKK